MFSIHTVLEQGWVKDDRIFVFGSTIPLKTFIIHHNISISLQMRLELNSKDASYFIFESFALWRYYVCVCEWILVQVLGGNLLPEAVTWLFASVLKGLQMHGQHEGCNVALTQLALLIYEALVRHFSSAIIACMFLSMGSTFVHILMLHHCKKYTFLPMLLLAQWHTDSSPVSGNNFHQ